MLLQEFEAFQRAEAEGRKRDAKRHVLAFVDSFADFEERSTWVWANWQGLARNRSCRIRHELWEMLLLPVFRRGFKENDLEALIALAECHQNWITDLEFSREPKVETDLDLWRQAYEMAPDDSRVKQGLLNAWHRVLDFFFHEWPSGLPGVDNSNWAAEVAELRSRITFCRALDGENRIRDIFLRYEQILDEFADRMRRMTTETGVGKK